MDAADYWDMIDHARRGQPQGWHIDRTESIRAAIERAAYTACCEHCGAALHHTGILIAGGRAVTLTTCPRCDTYRREDDA